jgi:Flp pilus assembly protein TadB
MSAVVMTLLPVVMLSIMLVTSAAVRGVASSPVGVATIALGIGLNAAGWRWMNHLVEGRE